MIFLDVVCVLQEKRKVNGNLGQNGYESCSSTFMDKDSEIENPMSEDNDGGGGDENVETSFSKLT